MSRTDELIRLGQEASDISEKGNHDGPAQQPMCRDRFVWIRSLDTLKVGEIKVVMCHYALRTWNYQHHGAFHTFGHSHGNLPDDESLALENVAARPKPSKSIGYLRKLMGRIFGGMG